jgi:catechol 2,3-dioxygenase-like lactoylglutathione lyase family enzyme
VRVGASGGLTDDSGRSRRGVFSIRNDGSVARSSHEPAPNNRRALAREPAQPSTPAPPLASPDACLSQGEGSLGYGHGVVALWIGATEHPVAADMKSGLHFCLTAPTPDTVNAFHAAALKTGGRDNGMPGLRADYGPGYYAAFVIDPDGYRIEAHCQS